MDFIEACFSIQYQLLPPTTAQSVQKTELETAFRTGALLYMKELMQEFTFSAIGSSFLVARLRMPLESIMTSGSSATMDDVSIAEDKLRLWMLVVGGVTSRQLVYHRRWFVAQLSDIVGGDVAAAMEWNAIEAVLGEVVWVRVMLRDCGKKLWEEVQGYKR